MSADSLGDRMKNFEDVSRHRLTTKLPMVLRLDGKAFHTYTRGLNRPYDFGLMRAMDNVTKFLCKNVQNCVMGYTQSDEISLLLVDYADIKTSSWFDRNLQKMVSVAAGMASSQMTLESAQVFGDCKPAVFDARAFVLPQHEVNNYFIWRQQDWHRNSLSMLAQSLYSHKELQGKGRAEQHELCFQKGINWSHLNSHVKDGRVAVKHQVEREVHRFIAKNPSFGQIEGLRTGSQSANGTVLRSEWHVPEITPIFSSDRTFVEKFVYPLTNES